MQNSPDTTASTPHARISNQYGVVHTMCVSQDGPQELALRLLTERGTYTIGLKRMLGESWYMRIASDQTSQPARRTFVFYGFGE